MQRQRRRLKQGLEAQQALSEVSKITAGKVVERGHHRLNDVLGTVMAKKQAKQFLSFYSRNGSWQRGKLRERSHIYEPQ